jgi:CRP/FNR family transcriptional regulator, cyclic AMP receptor protein
VSAYSIDIKLLDHRGIPLKQLAAGERIFLESEVGDAVYVVRSGGVDLIALGRVTETIGVGGIFGEMAIINDAPRTAGAFANQPTEVAVIDKPTFMALAAEEPELALVVMEAVTARVRRSKRM